MRMLEVAVGAALVAANVKSLKIARQEGSRYRLYIAVLGIIGGALFLSADTIAAGAR